MRTGHDISYHFLFLSLFVLVCSSKYDVVRNTTLSKGSFTITVLHFNDFHARYEPVNVQTSGRCKDSQSSCVGGFARLFTLTRTLKNTYPDSLILNAGDVFTGSLWFTLFKENVTATFLNKIPQDAVAIGNHEFDIQVSGLVRYLKLVKYPVVAANIDASQEPELLPLFNKSTIVEREGKRIGIIGYVTTDFCEIASVGKLRITDEITAVNNEAERLVKVEKVDIVIAVSHAGIETDIKVAKASKYVSLIVGGHSHTFLYTGKPPCPYDKPWGEYPIKVTSVVDQRPVLVVQAAAYSRYLGEIHVDYNSQGLVTGYRGNPIFLDKHILQDDDILQDLEPWKEAVDKRANKVEGNSAVFLDASSGACYVGECNIGYMLMDAMVHEQVALRSVTDQATSWTLASIAVMNSGGIRTSIQEGSITFADIKETIPFEDQWSTVEVRGFQILDALEFSVIDSNIKGPMQFYGIKALIDYSKPDYERVSNVKVLCAKCRTPRYEPLQQYHWYRVVLPMFVYQGGDGYTMFRKNTRDFRKGRVDSDILIDYLQKMNPVIQDIPGNIVKINYNRTKAVNQWKTLKTNLLVK